MESKISIVFSSHFSAKENNEFVEHVKKTIGEIDFQIFCIENHNKYSLTEAYNIGWNEVKKSGRGNGLLIFCHNDIVFKTKDWGKILLNIYRSGEYDIIGIAGSVSMFPHSCWWLTEDGSRMNTPNMFGRVWHTNGLREWESIYSKKIHGIKEVVVIDGLFMAVNGDTVVSMFDENFKGFHFYDISFCFKNYIEGCSIGVTDRISIMHKSIGQTNEEWEKNRQQFAELYKNELPVQI